MPTMEKILADAPKGITLRPESEALINNMAEEILQQTIDEFDDYRGKRNRQVDTTFWKPVQRVDHWQMFQDRKRTREDPRILKKPQGGYKIIDPSQSVPKFLLVGKVPGTVADFQYGDLSATAMEWNARSMFVGDNLVNTRYLHTITTPTTEKPYEAAAIMWLTMGNTIIPFIDVRDVLMLFKMGMTEGRDGEQIGYFIAHSIDIRETVKNNGCVRAQGSFCYLRRQFDPNFVEIYHSGFLATMGSIPEIASTKAVTMFLATSAQLAEAGLSRKLHWMMQRAFKNRSASTDSLTSDCAGRCGSGKSWISHGICVICHQQLCGRCKVRRRIILHIDRDNLKAKNFSFCKGCVLNARGMSADVCIRDDLKASMEDATSLTLRSYSLETSSMSDINLGNVEYASLVSFGLGQSSPKSERPTARKATEVTLPERNSSGDIIVTI